MEHYFCPVCHGVSDTPGVCQTDGCSRKGEALQACSCSDGQHTS